MREGAITDRGGYGHALWTCVKFNGLHAMDATSALQQDP